MITNLTNRMTAEAEGLGHLPTGDEIDRRTAEYRRAFAMIDSQGTPGYPQRVREAQAILARFAPTRKAVKP